MAHDIFISYAHEDQAIADMVCAELERHGIRAWIAPRDIQVGADWGGAIVAAIRGSRLMVLVFSDHANASRHIPRELERAIDLEIPIIPFRIKDVPPRGALEYHLSSVHWLDAVTPPIESHVEKLADTLRRMLGDRSAALEQGAPVSAATPATAPARRDERSAAGKAEHSRRPRILLTAGFVIAAVCAIAAYFVVSSGRSPAAHSAVSVTPPVPGANQPDAPRPSSIEQSAGASVHTPTPSRSAVPSADDSRAASAPRARSTESTNAASKKDADTRARCTRLNERASVGETLTGAEMTFLTEQCKDGR